MNLKVQMSLFNHVGNHTTLRTSELSVPLRELDYGVEPVTFKTFPAIAQVHRSVIAESNAKRVEPTNPYIANWLLNLGKNIGNSTTFYKNTIEELSKLEGILIYATSLHERIARFNAVKNDNEQTGASFDDYSKALYLLHKLYYEKYQRLHPRKMVNLELSRKILDIAYTFKDYKGSGYHQTLGHWLHLHSDKLAQRDIRDKSEILKIALAVEEIGYGSQNNYAPCLLRDLYKLSCEMCLPSEASLYQKQMTIINPREDLPEKYYHKKYDRKK
ncbi:MAG: hypothetical protein HY094_00765 [Candidatus Melainabacteria bacterium]|nr:hypothetical protein [Candidatus Melainabacteria bacterium]